MNKYWGVGIKENRYYAEWVKIFESKEKSAQLLYSIVTDDSIHSEDFSIGCQAIVEYIFSNSLWISNKLFEDLTLGIKDNIYHVEPWFISSKDITYAYQEDWVEKRKVVLNNLLDRFDGYSKVVKDNYKSVNDLEIIIEKQLALGLDKKDILNDLFVGLKDIAKNQCNVFPNVGVPSDFSKKLEDVLISLKELERKGVDVECIVQKVVSLLGVKKWLI